MVFSLTKSRMDLIDLKTLEMVMIFIKILIIDVISAKRLEMDMIAMKILEIESSV